MLHPGHLLRGLATLAGGALLGVGLVAFAPPAQAAEVVPRPSNGVLQVSGHGFGHGRGMSQWGAYGAATKGLTFGQIMSFYYPGTTTSAVLANSAISVKVTSDTDGATEVLAQSGLAAASGATKVTLPTAATTLRWRVYSSPAYTLQYYSTVAPAGWRTYSGLTPTGPVTFSTTAGSVKLRLPSGVDRQYLGTVTAVRYSGAHLSVVGTTMETYLRGVVPNEMPASWATEALKAQAVAARTYAGNQRASSPAGRPYQTCDSTACQVFDGYADYGSDGTLVARNTDARSDAAIAGTVVSGKAYVVRYGSSLAFTEFSASNGGWTTAGSVPYLVAKADPYDGVVAGSTHSWTDSVSTATLEKANPGIGRLTSLRMVRDGRGDWGGRVDTVVLVGTTGTATVSGTTFASQAGFLHRWWNQRFVPLPRDLTSDGLPDITGRIAATGELRTYRGTGSGYSGAISVGYGWNSMSVVEGAGDFSGDSRVDVLARETATGTLWIYPGRGDGRFGTRSVIGTGWSSFSVVSSVGDLSGDGLPDLLALRPDGLLRLYPSTGSRLGAGRTVGTTWGGFDRLVGMGDVDGDGYPDLVARQRSSGRLAFYRGNGRGGFLAGSTLTGGGWNAMSQLASPGDLTGDGRPDLLAVERATGTLWLYPGAGLGLGARRSLGTGWGGVSDLG